MRLKADAIKNHYFKEYPALKVLIYSGQFQLDGQFRILSAAIRQEHTLIYALNSN
jgi:hypothetical protein